MLLTEQLARERSRSLMETSQQQRHARQLRMLRRARRIEHRAERRMLAAWNRAAKLRRAIEAAEY
jgi:hypothetical protein